MSAAVKYAGKIHTARGQLGTDGAVQLKVVHQPEVGRRLIGEVAKIIPGINLVGLLFGAEALHPLAQGLGLQDRLGRIQPAPDHHLEHV